MPEGDVVRRTAARLHQALAGRPLALAELRWADLGGIDLTGRTVTEVVAYGKHLLTRVAAAPGPAERSRSPLPTAPAGPLTLRSHLRMDGKWFIHPTGAVRRQTLADHRIRAVLANAEWTAVGTLLGMLDLVPTGDEHNLLAHLGPDVMADDFPSVGLAAALHNLAANPQRHIGAALLDQTNVAGIGTIYMAESLFRQRISPWAAAGDVDAAAVLRSARELLLRSAQLGYARADRESVGGIRLYVHGRAGKRCFRCGATIRVAPVGASPRDRPAFYCPGCSAPDTATAPVGARTDR